MKHLTRALLRSAQQWLSIYDVDDEVAASFRAQQIQAVLRLTPLSVFANIFNAAVVLYALEPFPGRVGVWAWAAAVVFTAGVGAKAWFVSLNKPPRKHASQRALESATFHAFALGCLWAFVPLFFYQRDDATAATITATLAGGMICAGGFALHTIPTAAVAYVSMLVLGCTAAFTLDGAIRNADILALLLIYSAIVIASVRTSSKTFGARLVAEADVAKQKQLVSLLLHDFESNSSDWLWETDRQGCLRHVSERLNEVLSTSSSAIEMHRFVDLLRTFGGERDAESAAALRAFAEALETPEPFRHVDVSIAIGRTVRWWSMTGKPLFDDSGAHRGWRGVASDVTERHKATAEMTTLANFDSLTGLANRHNFGGQLENALQTAANGGERCVLLFFDLDNFKTVNDSLGHAAGDRVLKIVAARLRNCIRDGDVLARLGGDEFALLSRGDYDDAAAGAFARRLLRVFEQPCSVDGININIASSIGIALAPQDGVTPEALLKNADMALYAAKDAGRGTWKFFRTDMEERAMRRLNVHNDLVQALAEGQLEVHYQPQLQLSDAAISACEALLRWRHPTAGWISPSEFIPVAEDTGLIVAIGNWVLRESCIAATHWPDDVRLAVNVSPAQFVHGGIVREVEAALAWSGLPAERLEIEVTESLFMDSSVTARGTLGTLRSMGVRVALDDFGTGYSSLAYLRSFPISKLKIDRSFVKGIGSDASADAIVSAVIQLASALDLETTAEGIETAAQRNALAALGCTYGQGYLFSAALPQPALENILSCNDFRRRAVSQHGLADVAAG